MSYRTVTLRNGDTVYITESVMRGTGPMGVPGPPGPPGLATTIRGYVQSEADLPRPGSQGEAYVVLDTGHLWSWDMLRETPDWVDCGNVVGPAAVTSIGAQRTRNTSKNLQASTDYVVEYVMTPDWNDTDPGGGKVLDEAQMTTTNTAVDNDLPAYYLVATTISIDVAISAQTYSLKWQRLTGELDSPSTLWTDGKKQRVLQYLALLKTSSAEAWQLHISCDSNAVLLAVQTEWTRLGGGVGPTGLKGDPPTMLGGTTTTLSPGASATAAVVEDPPGSSTYRLDFGVPKGDPGEAQSGFSSFGALAGGVDSEVDPGGTADLVTDQLLPAPDTTQKPHIPYFFRALANTLYRLVVGRVTTAQRSARGAPGSGEVVYDLDLKQYLGGMPGRTVATTGWYQIATMQYGTSSAVYHGATTDRPNGSLYFKHE